MNIRNATINDASAIARVHVASWQAAYKGLMPDDFLASLSVENRTRGWHAVFKDGDQSVFVAEENARICGFASCSKTREQDLDPSKVGEIQAIYLESSSWGKRYGKALMNRSLTTLREQGFCEVMLWVLDSNGRAIRFYEGCGFAPDGQVKTETIGDGVEVKELRYSMKL